VRQDPRIRISSEVLPKQFDLARRIEAQRVKLAVASAQAHRVRAQLDGLRGKATGGIARQVHALIGKVDGVAPVDFSTMRYLGTAYADLDASVESADAAPTDDERQAFSKYANQLDGILATWEDLENSDIPRLNDALRPAKLEEVAIPH